MHYTLDDILHNFDSGTYGRGHGYVQRGKVRALALNNDRLESKVSGSGGLVYQQSTSATVYRGELRFKGACSCPMQSNCKHVVAALLGWLEQMPAAPAPSRRAEPSAAARHVGVAGPGPDCGRCGGREPRRRPAASSA